MNATLRRRYGHAGRKLSRAMIDALGKFAQAGGHGFGEYAYLSRATAMALYRLGYIEVGSAPSSFGKTITLGVITSVGLAALNANSTALARTEENSSVRHKPYGWSPWGGWSDADRAAEVRAQRRERRKLDPGAL